MGVLGTKVTLVAVIFGVTPPRVPLTTSTTFAVDTFIL
jgi:hypothetical protein